MFNVESQKNNKQKKRDALHPSLEGNTELNKLNFKDCFSAFCH
jgi:hypothetical protein